MNKEIYIKKRNGNLEKFSADKIVSWGGFDSKGTSGMGVTGSFSVLGNNIIQSGSLFFTTSSFTTNTRIYRERDGSNEGLIFRSAGTSGGYGSKFQFLTGFNGVDTAANVLTLTGTNTGLTYNAHFGSPSGSNFMTGTALVGISTYSTSSDSLWIFNNFNITNPRSYIKFSNVGFGAGLPAIGTYIRHQGIANNYGGHSLVFGVNNNSGATNETDILTVNLTGLGVRTNSPSATIHVVGSGTTSSTTSLLVQNANASASFQIKDDLTSTFGGSMTVISNDYAGIDLRRTVPNSLSWLQLYATGDFNPVLFKTGTTDWLGYVRNSTNIFLNRGNQAALNDNGGVSPTGSVISSDIHIYNATNSPKLVFWSPFSVQTPRGQISTSDGTSRGGNLIFSVNNNSIGLLALTEYMRITQVGNVGIGTPSPSASLHISGSSNSALLEIDSPTQNNILHVSGSGRVGIGKATDYALEVANTSSLLVSATGWVPTVSSTASAAVSITPNIFATAGNRSYYSLYVANPGITISGSFGTYDFRSIYAAGKIDAPGGINAGNSRFYATSNAVSFQGYNPFNGTAGADHGGITFTSRQVDGNDEAGIGATYGNGSRLFIYNKYNASDSKVIFSIGGTIRSTYFGTGNLSIGNGETDMSARLGVKGSGTTSSTTSFLVQNANASSSLLVQDGVSVSGFQVTAGNFTDSTFYRDSLWRSATLASARDITVGSDGTLNGYSSRLNFINYYSNGGQGNQSNFAGYLRTSIGQYTATGGPGGNQNSGRGTLLLGVYDSDYSSTVLNSFDVVSVGKYATTISGSVTVSSVLTLSPQTPLPSGVPTGSFAVSSSVPPKPYFYDGTTWNALY